MLMRQNGVYMRRFMPHFSYLKNLRYVEMVTKEDMIKVLDKLDKHNQLEDPKSKVLLTVSALVVFLNF